MSEFKEYRMDPKAAELNAEGLDRVPGNLYVAGKENVSFQDCSIIRTDYDTSGVFALTDRFNGPRLVALWNTCKHMSLSEIESGLVSKSELEKAEYRGITIGMLIAAAACIRNQPGITGMLAANNILIDAGITPDEIRSLDINDVDMEALQTWIDVQEERES